MSSSSAYDSLKRFLPLRKKESSERRPEKQPSSDAATLAWGRSINVLGSDSMTRGTPLVVGNVGVREGEVMEVIPVADVEIDSRQTPANNRVHDASLYDGGKKSRRLRMKPKTKNKTRKPKRKPKRKTKAIKKRKRTRTRRR